MVLPPCFLRGRFIGWHNIWSSSHGSSWTVLAGMIFTIFTSRSHTAAQIKWGAGSNGPTASAKPLSTSLCCLIFVLSENLPLPQLPFPSSIRVQSHHAPAQPAAQVLSTGLQWDCVVSSQLSPIPWLSCLRSPAGSACPPHPVPSRGCSWLRGPAAPQTLSTQLRKLAPAFGCLPFPSLLLSPVLV